MAHIEKRMYMTKAGEARTRHYVIAYGDDGKRVFHSRHQLARDAKAELHRVQVMEDSGNYFKPSANVTFAELAEEYLRDYVAVRCKQRTYDDYARFCTAVLAGLRLVHFHSLRHSYAALLVHAGVTPKALQAVMGHSTTSVTLDTYGHLHGDYVDVVVEKMDSLVFSPQVIQLPQKKVAEQR